MGNSLSGVPVGNCYRAFGGDYTVLPGDIGLQPLTFLESGAAAAADGSLTGSGILYSRNSASAENAVTAGNRKPFRIVNHSALGEAQASEKFCIEETGGISFRPGPSNPLIVAPVANFQVDQYALKFGNTGRSSASVDVSNAAIDLLGLSNLRLPDVGIMCPVYSKTGTFRNYNYSGANRIIAASPNQLASGGIGSSSFSFDSGLVPAGAWVFGFAYRVKATPGAGITASFGVAGDLSRYGSGFALGSSSQAWIPVLAGFTAATSLVITLSAVATSAWQVGIVLVSFRAPVPGISGTATFDA